MALKMNKRMTFVPQTSAALAWCAGFFDGDGCTSLVKQQLPGRKNPTYRLRLAIAQNCLTTLWRFQAVIDEKSFITAPAASLGTNKVCYSLVYDGQHAVRALKKMLPHLIRKKMGALAALKFWTHGRMGTLPGPKGFPPFIWRIREYWYRKLPRMAGR